ncbi:MAG: hypothetical protein ABI675_00710 [Chitinophagaceae bacterium]
MLSRITEPWPAAADATGDAISSVAGLNKMLQVFPYQCAKKVNFSACTFS